MINNSPQAKFPTTEGETLEYLIEKLNLIIFDKEFDSKRVVSNPDIDMVENSANNFYEDINQKEVEDYYAAIINENDSMPISYGLNSKMIKKDGQVFEKIYKIGGMYSSAIEKIVFWLHNAEEVAESNQQKAVIEKLIEMKENID